MTDKTRTAYLAVDVQRDFCEGGALAVDGGTAVSRAIASHLDFHGNDYDLLVYSKDWHIDPGTHWAETPDYVDTWPVHCAAGSLGANLEPALQRYFDARPQNGTIEVRKGQYEAAYSAFEGTTKAGENLIDVLRAHGIQKLVVGGIATDHCVRASVLHALEAGLAVEVRLDHIAGVDPQRSREALVEMELHGATICANFGPVQIGNK